MKDPCRFAVDLRKGHKTGFYSIKENRALLLDYARDRTEVLNSFSYTGAFGIYALRGGAARITHIESSSDALDLARTNSELNGFEGEEVEYREGNVFSGPARIQGNRPPVRSW